METQTPNSEEKINEEGATSQNNESNSTETPTAENNINDAPKSDEKYNELNDRFLRLFAEFENYKRRTSKERIELMGTAAKEFFVAMLPVMDDFERAMKSIEDAKDLEAVKEGVNLIYHKFSKTLHSRGLEVMGAKEKVFDSDIHEAITNLPAPSEDLKGKVLEELEKGYYLNGKVIRYAKVIVAN